MYKSFADLETIDIKIRCQCNLYSAVSKTNCTYIRLWMQEKRHQFPCRRNECKLSGNYNLIKKQATKQKYPFILSNFTDSNISEVLSL